MPIEFHCFLCGQRLRVADEHHGQRARCPHCETILDIPDIHWGRAATPILLEETRTPADVIDYEVFGSESQYVEITLDPGEIAIAKGNSLFYMSAGIEMEVITANAPPPTGGLLEKLAHAGKRILSGESLAMTAFCNLAASREVVAFAPIVPGKVVPLRLDELGEAIICRPSALLCVARGIEVSTFRKHTTSDDLVLQKLSGDGVAVLNAVGALMHRKLQTRETLHVCSDNVVAITPGVGYDLHVVGGTVGEKVSLAALSGPGEVWLQAGSRRP